jgi:glycosyltransferase involved in cell wall biosynthesis
MSAPRNVDTTLIIHPYTARKDLGAGHDRYAYELLANLPSYGVTIDRLESHRSRSMAGAALAEVEAVARLWRAPPGRVFHATATMNAMAPITARKHPLITTIHDVLWFFVRSRYDSHLKYILKTVGIKRAAAGSDLLIVPFQSTRQFLMEELKVDESKIRIVPYGVDHAQFCPPAAGETVPRPSFIPVGTKNVLFVGALSLGKGIDTLLRAFPAVVARIPEARLIIGSEGWDTKVVKSIWEESPVRDKMRFTGFIPEDQLRAAYVHADVTAFPSRYGFGLSTMESMACGTPTVSGRTLDAPEFIGDAGLLTDPESPDELAAQLVRVLTDSALHKELSAKGLVKSAAYGWDKTAEQTAAVYRSVV